MNNKDIFAMISLLDDPDEGVVSVVRDGLVKEGTGVIPVLEEAWEGAVNELFQTRVENIIHHIQFREVKKDMYDWNKSHSEDLLQGVSILTRFQYPEINYLNISKKIDKIVKDIWLELHDGLTALEKVRVINEILFNIYKYDPVLTEIKSPFAYHINHVLEQKRGGALGLGVLYLCIANKLNLPVSGVNLPNNFILSYMDDEQYESLFKDNVLFYIDPLSKGTVLGRQEIEQYLKRIQAPLNESFFTPCSNKDILIRMIDDLIFIHDELGELEKVESLKELQDVLL